MSDNRTPADGKFIIGFFLGGIIGALIIFFLGTKQGQKTGKILEKKGKDLLDDLQDKIEDMEQKGKEIVHQGEQIKQVVAEEIEDKKQELTQEATVKLDSALAHIEALQEHGRQTTSSLRKRLFKNIPKKGR